MFSLLFFSLGLFNPHSLVRLTYAFLFWFSLGQILKGKYLCFSFQCHLSTDHSQMLTLDQTSALFPDLLSFKHPAWDA